MKRKCAQRLFLLVPEDVDEERRTVTSVLAKEWRKIVRAPTIHKLLLLLGHRVPAEGNLYSLFVDWLELGLGFFLVQAQRQFDLQVNCHTVQSGFLQGQDMQGLSCDIVMPASDIKRMLKEQAQGLNETRSVASVLAQFRETVTALVRNFYVLLFQRLPSQAGMPGRFLLKWLDW